MVPASCVLFPSQFGSDYTGINLAGLLGASFGAVVALAGFVILAARQDGR